MLPVTFLLLYVLCKLEIILLIAIIKQCGSLLDTTLYLGSHSSARKQGYSAQDIRLREISICHVLSYKV